MTVRIVPDGPAARDEAAAVLASGGIVAIPTDTVYGLAASGLHEAAVARLMSVKGRSPEKGIALLLGDGSQAAEVGEMTSLASLLGRELWPGGLTLVIPARAGTPLVEALLGPGRTVGVRVPDHACPRHLARTAGPLPATSANLSGEPEARDGAAIASLFGESIDLIVDDGPAPGGRGSTVVDCTGELPRILRVGAIDEARIVAVLDRAGVGR